MNRQQHKIPRRIGLIGLMLIFTVLSIKQSYAQREITGVVKDAESGEVLPGVIVKVKGTTRWVKTKLDGSYKIRTPANYNTMVFTFGKYPPKEVEIRTLILNVSLSRKPTEKPRLVNIGYNLLDSRDIIASITPIDDNRIYATHAFSVEHILRTGTTGMLIRSSSGIPGGNMQMKIRGSTSLMLNSSPLVILDGVVVATGNNTSLLESSNLLAGINPLDIQSVDVLKDPATAAIFGARGGNGVIIITTKTGRHQDTRISISTEVGINDQPRRIPVLNGKQWAQLSLEAYDNYLDALYMRGSDLYFVQYQTKLEEFTKYGVTANGITPSFNNVVSNDWQNEVFQTGLFHNYHLAAQGGDDTTNFYIAASYNKTQSQVINAEIERKTARLNFEHFIKTWFSITTNISLSAIKQNQVPGGSDMENPYRTAYLIPPVNSVYNEDGSYRTDMYGYFKNNVVFDNSINKLKGTTNKATGDVTFNYQWNNGITFNSSYGLDYSAIDELRYSDPRTVSGSTANGLLRTANTKRMLWQTTQMIYFNKKVTKPYDRWIDSLHLPLRIARAHDLTGEAGVVYNVDMTSINSNTLKDIPVYSTDYSLDEADLVEAGSMEDAWKYISVLGRINYRYRGRYNLVAQVSTDASTLLSSQLEFKPYFGVMAAWLVTKEKFLKKYSASLDNIRLKISYGRVGNNANTCYTANGLFSQIAINSENKGLYAKKLAQSSLTSEIVSSLNAGLDFSIIAGTYKGDINYFSSTTTNALFEMNYADSTGISLLNGGTLQNTGVEINFSMINKRTSDYIWRTDWYVTYMTSKVLGYPDDNITNSMGVNYKDLAFGSRLIAAWAGVNPVDGRPMFYDKNGDLTYTPKPSDYRAMGREDPVWFGNIDNIFKYRGLEFSVSIEYSIGNWGYNNDKMLAARSGNTGDLNQYADQFTQRWLLPGQMTDVARAMYNNQYKGSAAAPYIVSSRNFERLDYIKLQRVGLTYSFPENWVNRVGLHNLRCYVQATNIYTLTEYSGYDPGFLGDDNGYFPNPRTMSAGMQISF